MNDPINFVDPDGLRGIPLPHSGDRNIHDMTRDRTVQHATEMMMQELQRQAERQKVNSCNYGGYSPVERVFPEPLPAAPTPEACLYCTEVNPFAE